MTHDTDLDDFRLTLGELSDKILDLIGQHGEDAIIFTDAGHIDFLPGLNPGIPKKIVER